MKKSLLLSIAVASIFAAAEIDAKGGHGGGGHHGARRHGGWHGGHHRYGGWGWGRGWGGWGPRIGFGFSVGGPDYYAAPAVYIDDPLAWYFNQYPGASWDAYVAWLQANTYRLRQPWEHYARPSFRRRWEGLGFGVGFGGGFGRW